MAERERLFLLDGMALAYRAYYSFISRPLINSKGFNTSAIFGFTTALLRVLDEEHPDHVAVVFDTPQPTFRHTLFPAYKATRQKMPEDMAAQLDKLKEVVRAFNTPTLELPGFEADDIIGTLARRAEREGLMTFLVTGDKDFMQLISPLIKMYKPGKTGADAEIVDERGVLEKFGVSPEKVTDVLGLTGDTSDNVPGVPGVGEKTAIPLIQKYGSIEELYAHLDEIPQKGVREKLKVNRELAFLSKRLVTIDTAAPVTVDIHSLRSAPRDVAVLASLFKDLEFKTLLPRVMRESVGWPTAVAEHRPEPPPSSPGQAESDITSDRHRYCTVATIPALQSLVASLKKSQRFVVDTETTGTDPMLATLVGLSFAIDEREAFYVPVRHEMFTAPSEGALFGRHGPPPGNLEQALDLGTVMPLLKPVLEDPSIEKVGQNIKYDMLVLLRHGITLAGAGYDTMVGSYVLRADGQHNLDALVLSAFGYRMVSYEDLTGKGKSQRAITDVPLQQLSDYSCEDADFTLRLFHRQKAELASAQLLQLCETIEFPLIPVLARMEAAGIALDVPYLKGMSKELDRQLQQLIIDIHRAAGCAFNINSTQQLGEILFQRLGMPTLKKTKTGFSTDVSVLESLRGRHPIIELLLEYRQLSKLKSTYIDALPQLIHPETGRVHTSFNQTVAATGRLSSSDPNLQNIPIRTEIGRSIRRAFIATEGMTILSADYSQIELRIMAHISGDSGLVEAFKNGEDIHASTAAKVFGVDINEVSRDMRRKAKEVIFGIMYGIGPFGLKNRLGIAHSEAQEIIDRYFQRFPMVRQYINDTIQDARKRGYVSTLFGRRRYFAEINSRNQTVRANAERAAINMPIQGTAADMIKSAMIRIDGALGISAWKSRMVLQVHDELVFEADAEEAGALETMVREHMVSALPLNVPIQVDVGRGTTWLEAH